MPTLQIVRLTPYRTTAQILRCRRRLSARRLRPRLL